MKTYGGIDVKIQIFLTSSLVGGDCLASRPGPFTPWESSPLIHCIGVWVGPRAGLDDVVKRKFLILLGLEPKPPCRPTRFQSLYLLRYSGSKY
jgi:hypothetical protein